jgi:mannose-6-phosphate isomerase-like protein (cupin superfamily)
MSRSVVWAAAVSLLIGLVAAEVRAQDGPGGTLVKADAIRAVADRSIAERTSDVAIRTIEAAGGHVGIGVIYRGAGHGLHQFSSHDAVTEVYQVLQGSGTIVSGGSLIDPQRRQSGSEVVGQLNGPSVSGSGIAQGTSQRLAPGDMIIIPAGMPHGFSEVDETMTIVVVRIDPRGVVALK